MFTSKENMMLDELMMAKREEILAACRAEVPHQDGVHRLAQCVTDFFDDIARLLNPQTGETAVPPDPVSVAMLDARVIGASAAMTRVRIAINRLSHRSRAPVLILGDAGTGRRHCARALHVETYPDGEFFELEDPDRLGELERRLAALRAQGGTEITEGLTVYVRNVQACAPKIQEKVAQLTRDRGLMLRLVVSSQQQLAAHPSRLCSDLLRAFPNELKLPPLVEREGDACELARHLARSASKRTSLPAVHFSAAALARLRAHTWPENVVELAVLVDRLSRERAGQVVDDADLSELDARASGITFRLPATGLDLAALERELLTQALAMAGNNQTHAASLLGLTRDQIRYRLAKFDLFAPPTRSV